MYSKLRIRVLWVCHARYARNINASMYVLGVTITTTAFFFSPASYTVFYLYSSWLTHCINEMEKIQYLLSNVKQVLLSPYSIHNREKRNTKKTTYQCQKKKENKESSFTCIIIVLRPRFRLFCSHTSPMLLINQLKQLIMIC